MSGRDLGALRGAMEGICASSLCTCDPDGMPNASMISQVHWVDEHHVALSYQFFNKTRTNLLATRQASVLMTDARTMARWRLQLDFVETRTEGPLFEIMKAKLAGIASLQGLEGVFRLLGADVFRVVSIEALAPAMLEPPRRGVPLLAAARACISDLAAVTDFDELTDATLDGLVKHFAIAHAMLLMAEGDGRLYAIGSRGYAASGIGAEVLPGEGVIGVAAREGVPIRIGHFSADYRYGAAIGAAALSAGLLAEAPRSVAFPGLDTPHSQIAVPILSEGCVAGVLFAESGESMRFWHEDEDALVIVAAQIGAQIGLLRRDEPAAEASLSTPAASRGGLVTVRRYARDDSMFIDHDYFIKGVAGAILWRLLSEHCATGRIDFTNRELRLDRSLRLPFHAENLDARLVLLRRRLEERGSCLQLEKTGRGQFRLVTQARVALEDADEGRSPEVA